jgi:hypothetical protein
LVRRAIELLEQWEQLVDPDQRDELALLAARAQIPLASPAVTALPVKQR